MLHAKYNLASLSMGRALGLCLIVPPNKSLAELQVVNAPQCLTKHLPAVAGGMNSLYPAVKSCCLQTSGCGAEWSQRQTESNLMQLQTLNEAT